MCFQPGQTWSNAAGIRRLYRRLHASLTGKTPELASGTYIQHRIFTPSHAVVGGLVLLVAGPRPAVHCRRYTEAGEG